MKSVVAVLSVLTILMAVVIITASFVEEDYIFALIGVAIFCVALVNLLD